MMCDKTVEGGHLDLKWNYRLVSTCEYNVVRYLKLSR
jgi:hypothetical protein